MENELEVVNIRLVKEPSLYSEQTLDSPQAVVELMAKRLPMIMNLQRTRKTWKCRLRLLSTAARLEESSL